ncbi:hypothetical protein [Xanthomonas melonis]|uniref:hypothetical protein n=1 Tax=Xanthomonas melonis TaxID=56456 RepID=UPI001E383C98|nr:hypothetical protein [Xanthomonas melonis]MCD0244407.1 hypothetical protein [Xanthomonas melonis]
MKYRLTTILPRDLQCNRYERADAATGGVAAYIPLLMRFVVQLPEIRLIFGFLLMARVLQSANIDYSAGRRHNSIATAERSAWDTMVV